MESSQIVDPFLKEALQNPRHRLTRWKSLSEADVHGGGNTAAEGAVITGEAFIFITVAVVEFCFRGDYLATSGWKFSSEADVHRGGSTAAEGAVSTGEASIFIMGFLQNPDQQLFEFPHFPTSYLRLAAHRVAQHYGLQSMVVDNVVDGQKTRIVVKKTAESRFPAIRLSEVPAEQVVENDKPEQVKISIKQRSQNASLNGANGTAKQNALKTMEERKEEYDRARARIFNSSSSSDSDDVSYQGSIDERSFCLSKDTSEGCKSFVNEQEKSPVGREGSTSRVAILRDREKDRSDPDYDRSYERYVRGLPPNLGFSLGPYSAQSFQPPFVQYETGFPPQHSVLPRSYRPAMSPFCAVGSNQTSGDSVYMQCPSLAMMYTHSYEQVRHAVFQAPMYHQPVCFSYSQNY